MRANLMTGGGDREHDIRPVLCEPPKNEERAARSVPFETGQQGVDAAPDPAGAGHPLIAPYDRLQRFDVKIFLDVHCKEVRGR
jgi:hypothetical protein